MYIVCKERVATGGIVAGTPPKLHVTYEEAKAEAERLMSEGNSDAAAFVVFQAIARTTRMHMPVTTSKLPPGL